LKQIITACVHVWFYLENRERTLESPTDKLRMSVTAFADELEREKARQRTYDALARKARAGHVCGGRVFGFNNVEVLSEPDIVGRRQRVRVERQINEAEATVIRRIFGWCADGMGYTRIAKRLNEERAPSPRAQQGRPCGCGGRRPCLRCSIGRSTGAR
jgi:DNA invertase Pin-like site-specific DNA recombinase